MFASPESATFWFNAWTLAGLLGAILVVAGGFGAWRADSAKETFAVQKANDASDALDRYKLETKGKVADAGRAASDAANVAYVAGKEAGEATAGLAHANAEIEKQKTLTSLANLETERIKNNLAWRTLPKNQINALTAALSLAPNEVNLRFVDGDPESQVFAEIIARAFTKAGWRVAFGSRALSTPVVLGLQIIDTEPTVARSLASAFTAAKIAFSIGNTVSHQGVTIIRESGNSYRGAPTILVGPKRLPEY